MRKTMLLLTATSLLMACGSKRIESPTPVQPAADVAAATAKKPAPPEKKAKKTEAKAEKKAEKASDKAEKASEKASKPAAKKPEKASEKQAAAAEKKAEKAAEKSAKPVEKTEAAHTKSNSPRKLEVPPGHYPLPGECRVWFPGRPPGQQPRATDCKKLIGKVPAGAFVLYNEKHYDADYDWGAQAERESWSVPRIIVQIMSGKR